VKDQTYSASGNAALVQSYETKTPVRVFRSKPVKKETGKWCPPIYAYEGLYRVLQHRLVPSEDGPLVRCLVRLLFVLHLYLYTVDSPPHQLRMAAIASNV
jgi:hypothetical protein